VKIGSKETIGRTTGRFSCNRPDRKVQGWEQRLKSRIKQPVVITVVWHSGKPSGLPKVNGNFLNGWFPFVFYASVKTSIFYSYFLISAIEL
jgi:hypothetical protein